MKSGLLESGLGGDIMESMFDQELSKKIASQRRLGIADALMAQYGEADQAALPLNLSLPKLRLPAAKREPAGISTPVARPEAPPEGMQKRIQDLPLGERLEVFRQPIEAAARQYRLDPNLLRAVIAAESAGNPVAESPKGAKGLMQLMDATARWLKVDDALDPAQNIQGGAKYLARLMNTYDGDLELALAGYNAGPTNVSKYGGVPPFSETRSYIQRVQQYYQRFSKMDE
jgi:soluble lytic murein transglycosylase-like protein